MKRFFQIKAVTFDVGGTLIEPWPSVGHIYAEVAARHGLKNLSANQLNSRFKSAWRNEKNFDYTKAAWAKLADATFCGLCDDGRTATFFPDLYEHFARAEAWRIFEEVGETLDALAARGLELGIISNWDERLRILLRRLDLEKRFEVIVISCEAGFTKPSPEIFQKAAKALHVQPQAILHVGDSVEMDLHGARSVGMRALHLQRDSKSASNDDSIPSLDTLLARIAK